MTPVFNRIQKTNDFLGRPAVAIKHRHARPDAAYPPSLIVTSRNDYLLSAINLGEPQYATPNAAYPP